MAQLLFPPKPIDAPDRIAVMVPTRGRPMLLARMLASFAATVEEPGRVEFWLAVDDDDQTTLEALDEIARYLPFPLFPQIAPRQPSLGTLWNRLWQSTASNPGYYVGFVDDYEMREPGWDRHLVEGLSRHPDRLALGYMPDPVLEGRDEVTIICATAQWLNGLGGFAPPYFPFWYIDSWHDQIASMLGRKTRLPIRVMPMQNAASHRLRDIVFWKHVFVIGLVEREEIARRLARRLWPEGSLEWQAFEGRIESVRAGNADGISPINLDFLNRVEKVMGDPQAATATDPVYEALKAEAADYANRLLVRFRLDQRRRQLEESLKSR